MIIIIFLVIFFSIVLAVLIKNISYISQLKYQNRLLRALRSLDIAALSTTKLEPLCQAIVDVIHKELGYFMALIMLVDYKRGYIRRITLSRVPGGDEILKILPMQIKDQVVPLTDKENTLVKVVNSKNKMYITDLYEIQRGIFPQAITQKLQQQLRSKLNIRGFFLYPLITKDKVIGIIEYPSTLEEGRVPKFELNVMEEFTAEVARTLENVMLYEDLDAVSKQLEKANMRLIDLDKLKDEFVSVASHELRTPLTAIRSYAWMAVHRSDIPLSQKLDRYLYRILTSTERLINLVSDMLNLSRIESGHIEINPRSFDILALVNDIVEEVRPKADEKKLKIMVLQHPMLSVFADQDKVREILINLIGNSLKFTYPGGLITISFFAQESEIEISVKDTGQGIARDDLPRLFTKFGKLDASFVSITVSGGTGLGLYISKRLVELMHGRIWADSEGLEKGATFTFSLPRATKEILAHADEFRVKPQGEVKALEPVAI